MKKWLRQIGDGIKKSPPHLMGVTEKEYRKQEGQYHIIKWKKCFRITDKHWFSNSGIPGIPIIMSKNKPTPWTPHLADHQREGGTSLKRDKRKDNYKGMIISNYRSKNNFQ